MQKVNATNYEAVSHHLKSAIDEYAYSNYTFASVEAATVPNLIRQYATGQRIVDLGCGPVLPITALLLPPNSTVVGIDSVSENLLYVRSWIKENEIRQQQARAAAFRLDPELVGVDVEIVPHVGFITQRMEAINELVHHDVTRPFPQDLGKFDCAMQVGCFLCLDTYDDLRLALKNTFELLSPGGRFLSINWLQPVQSEIPLKFNGPLSSQMDFETYKAFFEEAGFSIETAGETNDITSVAKRNGYSGIVWVVAERS